MRRTGRTPAAGDSQQVHDPNDGEPSDQEAEDVVATGEEDGGYRHLPVVKGGRILGVVSRRDFYGEEKAELEKERFLWERIG